MFIKKFFKIAICLTIINTTIVYSSCIDEMGKDDAFLRLLKLSLHEKRFSFAKNCLVLTRERLSKELLEKKSFYLLKNFLNRLFKNKEYNQDIDRITEDIKNIEKQECWLASIEEKIFDKEKKLKSDEELLKIDFSLINAKNNLWLHNNQYVVLAVNPFLWRGRFQQKQKEEEEEERCLRESVFAQAVLNKSEKSLSLLMRSEVGRFLGVPGSLDGEGIIEPIKKSKNNVSSI